MNTAVILAAGAGERLRAVHSGAPKGLLRVGEHTLVGRALRLYRAHGIERVVLVSGFGAAHWPRWPDVEVVHNPDWSTTGSFASLARALERVDGGFLLAESDLFFEARAVAEVLRGPGAVVLASGPTAAGDEVWIEAPHGRLRAMSKRRDALASAVGELVGLTRVTADLAGALRAAWRPERAGWAYETDALVHVAATRPIAVRVVPDLLWGEIDHPSHLERVRDRVAPRVWAGEVA